VNEHIKEYCENFIESIDNPQFAVFLKGNWGTGKTYFIDTLLDKYKKSNKANTSDIDESHIIKISLFGVKSYDDIDIKIYEAVHPVLSSNGMKIAGAVARSALKLGTSIDFNGDKKNDISMTIGGFSFGKGKTAKNIAKKLIVVDDFERALLEPCEIFGYFSEIIAQSNTKVIFIGNEEKIAEQDEQKKTEYLQIKEKIIGIEFEIEPDSERAIDHFVEILPFQNKDFFKTKTKEIIQNLGCTNLRTVWQALYNLHLLITLIDEEIEDTDKEYIFSIFLVLYIQKNLEEIHKDDQIIDILSGYFKHNSSYKKYKEMKEERKKENEYFFFLDITEYIPLLSSWPRLIFDGYYNKEWLVKNYKEEKNAIKIENEKTDKNLFKLLRNWGHLNKTDFEPLIKLVFKEFDEGMYLHPGEILHFASIMMLFSKWNLIPDTIDTIFEKTEKFLTAFSDKVIPVTGWAYLTEEYAGYGYNADFPEFEKILNNLREINSENVKKHASIDIREEVKFLNTDGGINIFCKDIIHINGSGKYYKQPILSFLDMESFYNILKTLSIENQQRILYSFIERYGKRYSNEPLEKEYYPDYENLKTLCNIYKSDVKDIYYDPQEMLKSNLAEEWAELLSYFKRKINA